MVGLAKLAFNFCVGCISQLPWPPVLFAFFSKDLRPHLFPGPGEPDREASLRRGPGVLHEARHQDPLAGGAAGIRAARYILGGWMRFTPRFPKTHWEIVKIHGFSWIFNENPSKSMKNHGF